MAWDGWSTVFYDDRATVALYDYYGPAPDDRALKVRENVLVLGVDGYVQLEKQQIPIVSFLRPQIDRYRDVDVTIKVQIESTAKSIGGNEDLSHWFGLTLRALRTHHWDAYLFYIRKNGKVEFGVRGDKDVRPPPIPEVASQPVTIRVRVESDRVQTWVNGRQYHDWRDKEHEFIRKGDIYLTTYAARAKIYEVKIRVKKWYAPISRFLSRSWKIIIVLGIIVSLIAGVITIIASLR
jgi:hypothetical protein